VLFSEIDEEHVGAGSNHDKARHVISRRSLHVDLDHRF